MQIYKTTTHLQPGYRIDVAEASGKRLALGQRPGPRHDLERLLDLDRHTTCSPTFGIRQNPTAHYAHHHTLTATFEIRQNPTAHYAHHHILTATFEKRQNALAHHETHQALLPVQDAIGGLDGDRGKRAKGLCAGALEVLALAGCPGRRGWGGSGGGRCGG